MRRQRPLYCTLAPKPSSSLFLTRKLKKGAAASTLHVSAKLPLYLTAGVVKINKEIVVQYPPNHRSLHCSPTSSSSSHSQFFCSYWRRERFTTQPETNHPVPQRSCLTERRRTSSTTQHLPLFLPSFPPLLPLFLPLLPSLFFSTLPSLWIPSTSSSSILTVISTHTTQVWIHPSFARSWLCSDTPTRNLTKCGVCDVNSWCTLSLEGSTQHRNNISDQVEPRDISKCIYWLCNNLHGIQILVLSPLFFFFFVCVPCSAQIVYLEGAVFWPLAVYHRWHGRILCIVRLPFLFCLGRAATRSSP